MSDHANPSRDPANDDSLLGMANEILKKHLQGVDDMLPARVISYDRVTNRAQVIPLVRVITTANQLVDRPQVASIPVLQYGGGGFLLSFPLKPGNLGWIKANDRDISLVLQSYAVNAPNSRRMHSFSDALFIPDVMTGYTLADDEAAVLQNLDGSLSVALTDDSVKITAGEMSFTLTAAGHTFIGPVNMPDGATIGGISFNGHRHPINSGSSAPGPTGTPVP